MAKRTLSFEVEMVPKAKGRPRFGGGRTYTDKKTANAEAKIKAAAQEAVDAQLDGEPLRGPVFATVGFTHRYPQNWKGPRDGLTFATKRPDLDNLLKLVMDAVNKVAYADDASVVLLQATKRYAARDTVEVLMRELE